MSEARWRALVCSFLAQNDLANLAAVNKAWNIAATEALYEYPNLSTCDEAQLRAFLSSVKSGKSRRRMVKSLDLLVPRTGNDEAVFAEDDYCKVAPEQQFRCEQELFGELFSIFKKLVQVRINGHALHDAIKAHWSSLSQSLVELRIYNLGDLSDSGVLKIAAKLASTLKILHIEHPSCPARSLRVGTIELLMDCIPNLKHLGIGLPLQNIGNNRNFLERLFTLESLTLIRVPDVDFMQLMYAEPDSKWRNLVVKDCPGMTPEGLSAVLRRLPALLSLDWRFPDETFYEWETNELTTAGCRRLQKLVLENGFFSDQCLMRMFRVTSSLETLALSSCENVHRFRSCSAGHFIIKNLPNFLILTDAFEECMFDLRSVILIEQSFRNARNLASTLFQLFREASQLQFVEFDNCHLDAGPLEWKALVDMVGQWTTVTVSEKSGNTPESTEQCAEIVKVRFTASFKTQRRQRALQASAQPRSRARY